MKSLILLLIPLILLASCIQQEIGTSQNTTTLESGSGKISYHSGYEIHHEKDGSTTLIAGSEKNTCPPGMYPKGLDGCVKDPEACPEGQTLTGFAGTRFCAKSDDTRSYYERLGSQCAEDSFGYAGCIASITHMQSRGYRLALSETCPENFKIEGYTVAGGYTWCAPSDTYYQKLRASCAEDSCCLSSVNTMEQGRFIEASDGKCSDGLYPNSQRCQLSRVWCQYGFLVKDFGSGFTLRQNNIKTELFLGEKLIRDWSHTTDIYPFIREEGCKDMFAVSMRKNPNPTNSSDPLSFRKYIWSVFSLEEKANCMKEFYFSSIAVSSYSARFATISWSDDDRYCLSIYDKETGNMQDFFSNTYGDTLKSIQAETGSIFVTTKFTKKLDNTEYTTIFDPSFSGVTSTIVTD